MNFKLKGFITFILSVAMIISGITFTHSGKREVQVMAEETQTDILFIGNSMTYYNTLCNVVQGIAKSKGHSINCSAVTNGGKNLIYNATADNVLTAIKKGGYEVVILQDIVGSFDSDRLMKGAGDIIPVIKKYNPNAEIVFYEPWPVKPTLTGMNSKLPYFTNGYIQAARAYKAKLAPAGETFYNIYVNSGLDYYCSDTKHPQPLGTFISAATIYYTLYNEEYSAFASEEQEYLDKLINDNVAFTTEGIQNTYSLDTLNLIMERGHYYANAVKSAVADGTGATTYVSAAGAYVADADDVIDQPEVTVKKTAIKSATKKKTAKKAKILLKKVKGVTGYELKLGLSKKLKKSRKIISKKCKFTIKKLKPKKQYYIKARAYKKVDGVKYCSGWTKVKKVKIKK